MSSDLRLRSWRERRSGWRLASVNQTALVRRRKRHLPLAHVRTRSSIRAAAADRWCRANQRSTVRTEWECRGVQPGNEGAETMEVNMGFVMDAFSVEGPVSDRNDGQAAGEKRSGIRRQRHRTWTISSNWNTLHLVQLRRDGGSCRPDELLAPRRDGWRLGDFEAPPWRCARRRHMPDHAAVPHSRPKSVDVPACCPGRIEGTARGQAAHGRVTFDLPRCGLPRGRSVPSPHSRRRWSGNRPQIVALGHCR